MYFHVLLMLSNNFTLNFAKNSCAKLALFSFTILTVLVNRNFDEGPCQADHKCNAGENYRGY